MSKNPHLPHTGSAPAPRGATLQVLATAVVMLVLTWIAVWFIGLGEVIALAVSLAIVVVALLVIGWGRTMRRNASAAPTRVFRPAGDANHGLHGLSDPLAAELIGPTLGKRWSLDVFESIDAQRFAAVCETWFSWAGFDTRSESHRTNEGVDIWLHAARMPGPVAIVRCKHGQDKPVGLQEMREFQGVVSNCQSAHGTFTTTSTYTPEALQFAREHGIDAVDGKGLLRKILTRTRQSQQALLAVAYNGR